MLTIKTKVTSEVEKTIPLPYYFKNGGNIYRVTETGIYGVINFEKWRGGTSAAILEWYAAPLTEVHKQALNEGTEITYLEFEIALNKTLDFLKETALSEGALKEAI
jgi:hypothetical protein